VHLPLLHVEAPVVQVDAELAAAAEVGQADGAAVVAGWQADWSPLQDFSQQPAHAAAGASDSAAVIRSMANTHVAYRATIKTAGVDFISNPSVTGGRKTGES
jgi:hypothetical protein